MCTREDPSNKGTVIKMKGSGIVKIQKIGDNVLVELFDQYVINHKTKI